MREVNYISYIGTVPVTYTGIEAMNILYSTCQTDPKVLTPSEESYNSTHLVLEFNKPVKAINWSMYFHSSIKNGGYVYYYYKGEKIILASNPHSTYVRLTGKVFDKVEINCWDSNGGLTLFNKGFELSYDLEE